MEVPDKLVEELELPVHARECLVRARIRTVRELVELSEEDLLRIRGVGRKTACQIMEALQKAGAVCIHWDMFYL